MYCTVLFRHPTAITSRCITIGPTRSARSHSSKAQPELLIPWHLDHIPLLFDRHDLALLPIQPGARLDVLDGDARLPGKDDVLGIQRDDRVSGGEPLDPVSLRPVV